MSSSNLKSENQTMKKIFILFAAALTIGLTGCQSFLEEETYGSTTEIFKEENGIKALVYQSYTKINNLYGGDGQWPLMTELGTDIYLRGKNQGDVGLCDYYGLDATNGNVAWLWNHCYKALFNINLFFETIDQTPFADEDEKSQFKAEMYVMRALFLWIVTETWGDSYLPMTTDETEGTEARRSPRAKFYEEIIGALETAIGLFPDTRTTESGRIDMPAAKALLARMYLYNEQWDEAADMASQVIATTGWSSAPRSKTCGPTTRPTTNSSGRRNSPRTTPSARPTATGRGMPCISTVSRACRPCSNGRVTAAARRSPLTYFMDLFDRDADKRWSDLHQWVWYYNDPADDRRPSAATVARIHRHGALPLPRRTARRGTQAHGKDLHGIRPQRHVRRRRHPAGSLDVHRHDQVLRPHPAGATCRSCRIAATL